MVTNEGIKINKPVEEPIEKDNEEIDFSIEFDGNNKGEK